MGTEIWQLIKPKVFSMHNPQNKSLSNFCLGLQTENEPLYMYKGIYKLDDDDDKKWVINADGTAIDPKGSNVKLEVINSGSNLKVVDSNPPLMIDIKWNMFKPTSLSIINNDEKLIY